MPQPMMFGQEWALAQGRPESADRELEAYNRNANLMNVANVIRFPFVVKEDGHFLPTDTNSAITFQSYGDALAVIEEHNGRIIPCLMLHTLGEVHGEGYHKARPPIIDREVVKRYAQGAMSFLADHQIIVVGWQLGNELDYAPNMPDGISSHVELYEAWERCYFAVQGILPPNLPPISPGSGSLEAGGSSGRGKPSINRWIAESGRHPRMILDLHGNGLSIEALQQRIDELRRVAPQHDVGIFEDRPPDGSSDNDCRRRAIAARSAGAASYFVFGGRVSNPSGGPCRWGSSGDRSNVGIETCDFAWHQANYQQARGLAVELGTLKDPEILPVDIGEENGGNEGGRPPGWVLMKRVHSLLSAGKVKRAKTAYRHWLSRVGITR